MTVDKSHKPKDNQVIFEACKRKLAGGANIEIIISYLKGEGYSQGPSVFFLQQLGVPSSEAKQAVIKSEAWKESRKATDALHEAIESELDKSPNIFEK